jgi:hypothetical protein
MRLSDAIELFESSGLGETRPSESCQQTLYHLQAYFSELGLSCLAEFTPERVRDFAGRYHVDQSKATARFRSDEVTRFLACLSKFVLSAGELEDARRIEFEGVINELRSTLPRALRISSALSSHISERGGPFGFPEFLTSFEDGGRGAYDFDQPDQPGALEGYFEITRIDGSLVEVRDVIYDKTISPIVFPPEVTHLLETGFVINLELVLTVRGWEIAGCGLAYPPGCRL